MFTGGPCFYEEYARMRHQELIQAAEKHRLLRQAIQNQEKAYLPRYRLHQKALLGLGRQMIAWGTGLQRRYNRDSELPALAAYPERRVYGE